MSATERPHSLDSTAPVELGAAAIKALSHELRVKLLWELARVDTARTSDLAAAIEAAPNKASYHLKILHEHGIIGKGEPPEDPERAADGRETWWRMASSGGIAWNRRDPAVAAVAGELERTFETVRDAPALAAQVNADGALPQMSSMMPVPLTLDEAHEFHDRFVALFEDLYALRQKRLGTGFHPEVEYDAQLMFLPVWRA